MAIPTTQRALTPPHSPVQRCAATNGAEKEQPRSHPPPATPLTPTSRPPAATPPSATTKMERPAPYLRPRHLTIPPSRPSRTPQQGRPRRRAGSQARHIVPTPPPVSRRAAARPPAAAPPPAAKKNGAAGPQPAPQPARHQLRRLPRPQRRSCRPPASTAACPPAAAPPPAAAKVERPAASQPRSQPVSSRAAARGRKNGAAGPQPAPPWERAPLPSARETTTAATSPGVIEDGAPHR